MKVETKIITINKFVSIYIIKIYVLSNFVIANIIGNIIKNKIINIFEKNNF